MRAYGLVALLLLAIFGSIGAYLYQRISGFANRNFSPPPVVVSVDVAREEQWGAYLDSVGTIRSAQGIDLSAETSGEVVELYFDSGQAVKKGQLLLLLDDEVEQAARANQIASLELAQLLYDRDSKLVEQKSIPQSQYDRSRADLARAQAQLAETEARIRNKRIYAPFSGTIGIRHVDVGDYLSPGSAIASLQDLDQLEIDFTLPGRVAPQVRAGMQVELLVDAFPDRVYSARVSAIDSRVDMNTRNLLLRARLEESEGLLPGMFARVRIVQPDPVARVTVPETALTYSVYGDTVFVVRPHPGGEGQTAESVVVKAGDVRQGRVAILQGIEPGDQVVTAGQNKLYRDVKIAIGPALEP